MRSLDFLYVTLFPPSPPTFGAQRRIEGLMRSLSQRHRVTGLSLYSPEYDAAAAESAMGAYCRKVVLVPAPPRQGLTKRLAQARSLVSLRSFERSQCDVPALRVALSDLLRQHHFDAISIEAPFFFDYDYTLSPPGTSRPMLLVDQHNIEHDLVRQSRGGPVRRLHGAVNWRKMLREEVAMWHRADGAVFTSDEDLTRARSLYPGIRGTVVPNAVDIHQFRPDPGLPAPDGRTLVFFGTMNYYPNLDGIRWFLAEIWPLLSRSHPQARLKIIGAYPAPEVLAHAGPRVEVTGLVDDLRPHLASAAATIVPLRVGGGTRFKILEAMAMGRPVVSTTIGAEGIAATVGKEILIADTPADFAAAAGKLIDEPATGVRMGTNGRVLVEQRYSWEAAAGKLEAFVGELIAAA